MQHAELQKCETEGTKNVGPFMRESLKLFKKSSQQSTDINSNIPYADNSNKLSLVSTVDGCELCLVVSCNARITLEPSGHNTSVHNGLKEVHKWGYECPLRFSTNTKRVLRTKDCGHRV